MTLKFLLLTFEHFEHWNIHCNFNSYSYNYSQQRFLMNPADNVNLLGDLLRLDSLKASVSNLTGSEWILTTFMKFLFSSGRGEGLCVSLAESSSLPSGGWASGLTCFSMSTTTNLVLEVSDNSPDENLVSWIDLRTGLKTCWKHFFLLHSPSYFVHCVTNV